MIFHRSVALCVILIGFLSNLSIAQQREAEISEKLKCNICVNGKHFHTKPYDFTIEKEWPFISAGVFILGTGILVQATDDTKPFTVRQVNSLDGEKINFFDEIALDNLSESSDDLSDIIRSGATILPLYFLLNHHTREDILPLIGMGAEVFTISFGINILAKNVVNRTRPLTFNPQATLEKRTEIDARRSFYSGHTAHTAAFTFFMAKVISDYHPHAPKAFKAGLWSFSAVVPALSAWLRVRAGKHFPTDVITGYIAGAAIGYLIPHLHKTRKQQGQKLSYFPVIDNQSVGAGLLLRF